MSRFTCPELDHSLALVLFPAAMVSEAIRHACPGSGLRPHGKCNASFRPSLFAKSEAARNGENFGILVRMWANSFWKVCAALDNPHRLKLLRLLLADREYPCVNEIADKMDLNVGATSSYLKQLRDAGLVTSACSERRVYYRAIPGDVRCEMVVEAFRHFFEATPSEDRLHELLKVIRALAHRRRNAYLRFLNGRPGADAMDAAKALDMPPATVDRIFNQLGHAHLVDATGSVTYTGRQPEDALIRETLA